MGQIDRGRLNDERNAVKKYKTEQTSRAKVGEEASKKGPDEQTKERK
jgi:hypothetical protein